MLKETHFSLWIEKGTKRPIFNWDGRKTLSSPFFSPPRKTLTEGPWSSTLEADRRSSLVVPPPPPSFFHHRFSSQKSIEFDHVRVQAGSDSTGVATDMITMNSTLKFTYRNTGTFFGVHVTATPLELSDSDIVIASGNMRKFYQSRKSARLVSVAVMGNKIPLYGSGASLSSTTGMPTVPVPLNLNFVLRLRAYVLGKLVKPKYYKRIECSNTYSICP